MKRALSVVLALMFVFGVVQPAIVSKSAAAAVAVTSIKLNTSKLAWPVGRTGTFKATVYPSNASNREVTWKSGNTKVATVDSSGKLTAKGYGTATITCTSKSNRSAKVTCSVTVGKGVTFVKLNTAKLNWNVGKTGTFKATVFPNDAIRKELIWKSSNPAVASVSSKGLLIAKKAGNATITCASAFNSKAKATCIVSVKTVDAGEANKQWRAAYKDFFSDASDPLDNYQSVYVNDINRDGIPEVFIDRWGIGCPQLIVTYIKDKGISTLMFDIGSGSTIKNRLYIGLNQNKVVLREDGNSSGTHDYHQAVIYTLGEKGFKKTDEISGDELNEDFNYNDSAALEAHMEKSHKLFDKKFSTFTKGMNLIDYTNVAITKNIKNYLFNELKLNNS